MFPGKAENVFKAKLILETLRRKGLRKGRENGEKARKFYRNEIWSGFNLCQLANKSLKAVLSMDSPAEHK